MREKIRGVIFDFDGVIVDSEYRFTRGVKGLLEGYGLAPSEEELARLPGQPIPSIIRSMKDIFHLEKSEEELMADMHIVYGQIEKLELDPVEGIEEFIQYLKDQGIRYAVATSANVHHITDAMEQAGLHFWYEEVVTHDDVTHGKPDPEVFLKTAQKLSLPKENLIIIEDSANGVRAGIRSGIFTIGLKNRRVPLDISEADLQCEGYSEIKQYIEERNNSL